MKIQRTCDAIPEKPTSKTWRELPLGTVFRYGDQHCGPYLRVTTGIVNLATDEVYGYSADHCRIFDHYTELPNARIVLE